MNGLESAANVELPTVVTVLAKLIYSMMNRQIERLQGRVDKLQRGAGVRVEIAGGG
ncbi:hypothetical protein OKA04_24210 [Luteolibacter flavescens]|uniref:Uncharacterized protein n=1 Tax=Luteolibacter flavescens TaxID=1859460 RepID=A0ABT3FWB7_9BACT|nr:hypothetical protein [Luteolibacter flavescens]MCW1887865.1 hypothetical protein [Luteolibacter flavescens]